jgi:N-acetyl-anhydromuramyl-L-alanine amidase AmpD
LESFVRTSGPVRTYSRPAPDPAPGKSPEFVRAIEDVSRGIRNPVAKLRFIRLALARYQRRSRLVEMLPWEPLRRRLFHWLGLEELRYLLGANSLGASVPIDAATRASLFASRMAHAGVAIAALSGLSLLGAGVYQLWRTAPAPAAAAAPLAAPRSITTEQTAPVAKAGVLPAGVWLVEQSEAYEQYSNGLRIETSFATTGEARAFRTLTEDGALEPGTQTKPIGLLFHTSESDIWPLVESNNEQLRDSSRRLLKYVQRNRLYHYLIDRFGRAYRVVDEGAKANHAGFGVWLNEGKVYLNLNHAFLGVSFETRWEGGKALPITQAQLETGRNLSDFLRQRYEIRPEMCVTHGLTSVNPKKRLIGHHMDWARGFPFEAFGLPDQYQRAAPSVTLFGFGYDEDFLKVMDKPWPGVAEAFRRLEGEALVSGKSLDEVRLERQLLFDRWWALQSQGETVAGAEQQAASQSQSSGG